MPVAWKTALAIAAFVPTLPSSPSPLMPRAFTCSSFSWSKINVTSPTSALTGISYPARSVLVYAARSSISAASCSAELMPQILAAHRLAADRQRVDDAADGERADEARHAASTSACPRRHTGSSIR